MFFCWHFLVSIYEVRYKTSFKSDALTLNNQYFIKCVGLNSLGWEINYRDLKCNFTVISGNELIRVGKTISKNEFIFIPLSAGQLIIQANSQLSLNPSEYKLEILNSTVNNENLNL
ncbi:MAG: hypothetical protein OQJ81_04005 [Melioribacteraceae bacterium]|nr:hypothetical protein [Melioribacteraceae bacterium]